MDRDIKFWKKVDKNGPMSVKCGSKCWMWSGEIHNGYGRFTYFVKNKKTVIAAHRMAWIVSGGKIKRNEIVRHICNNPLCVNVEHLKTGTNKENTADMISSGRAGWMTHPERNARGESHGMSKLTADKVRLIRTSYAGGARVVDIAEQHNICASTVYYILRGEIWKLDQPYTTVTGD